MSWWGSLEVKFFSTENDDLIEENCDLTRENGDSIRENGALTIKTGDLIGFHWT